MNKLTIVMYHYVRNVNETPFPEIKAIPVDGFKQQVEYFKKYYTFVTVEQCIEKLKNSSNCSFPDNAILLTFDDGYMDHYLNVFPVLSKNNIQGCFFPPVKIIKEQKVLEVNKIQFALSATSVDILLKKIYQLLDEYREEFNLQSDEYYFNKLAKKSRLDTKEVIFIKRLLQMELPTELRTLMANQLFSELVTSDEKSFASELYMNIPMLQEMVKNGMHIGSHGSSHSWMDTLPLEEQENEVVSSLSLLKQIGVNTEHWSMCYPFGAYNHNLLEILKKHNCQLAFTTKVGIADLSIHNALTLERLDTNDFPRDFNHEANEWTQKIIR